MEDRRRRWRFTRFILLMVFLAVCIGLSVVGYIILELT